MLLIGYAASGSSNDFFCRNAAGLVWDITANSNAGGYVAWVDANYQNYRVPAIEQGTSGCFLATAPDPGIYFYDLRPRQSSLAASPATWARVLQAGTISIQTEGITIQ